jgi:hypothetical protein
MKTPEYPTQQQFRLGRLEINYANPILRQSSSGALCFWKENDQKTLANDNPIGGLQNVAFCDCPSLRHSKCRIIKFANLAMCRIG